MANSSSYRLRQLEMQLMWLACIDLLALGSMWSLTLEAKQVTSQFLGCKTPPPNIITTLLPYAKLIHPSLS
jgi:hypothetical protein